MNEDPIYKNSDALVPLRKLSDEASAALADKTRVASTDSDINAALAAAGGITAGGSLGFAALYFAGVTGLSAAGITSALAAAGALIGGGMAAGIAVLAAPAVLLGVGAYAWVAQINKTKLIENKESLLVDLSKKHNQVVSQLKTDSQAHQARSIYLANLNTLLEAAIRDLEADLKIHKK